MTSMFKSKIWTLSDYSSENAVGQISIIFSTTNPRLYGDRYLIFSLKFILSL